MPRTRVVLWGWGLADAPTNHRPGKTCSAWPHSDPGTPGSRLQSGGIPDTITRPLPALSRKTNSRTLILQHHPPRNLRGKGAEIISASHLPLLEEISFSSSSAWAKTI